MMKYKGYLAKVDLDDEADIFHGQVVNIRDIITFQGSSIDELKAEFAASVDEYLAFCAERGEKPDKPFSGNIPLRIDQDLHREVSIAASLSDQSVNSWIASAIRQALHAGAPVAQARAVTKAKRLYATSNTVAVETVIQAKPTLEAPATNRKVQRKSTYSASTPQSAQPVLEQYRLSEGLVESIADATGHTHAS